MTEPAVLLFPGMDAYSTGVLRQARSKFDEIDDVFAEVDREAAAYRLPSLSERLFGEGPPPSLAELGSENQEMAELAVFSVSLSVFRVLAGSGFSPFGLMGRSFGEIAALTAAGAFSTADGVCLIHARYSAFEPLAKERCGGMAFVGAAAETVCGLLGELDGTELQIAVVNTDTHCLISGPVAALDRFGKAMRDKEVPFAVLDLPYAAHHDSVRQAATSFLALAAPVRQRRLQHPVFSPVRNRWYDDGDDLVRALSECMWRPVHFSDAVRALHAVGARRFVEAGARSTLTRCVTAVLAGRADVACLAPLADPATEADALIAATSVLLSNT